MSIAMRQTVKSFQFKTQMSLVEMTGLKASDLAELGFHLKKVPNASVYYHTHHFLQQHQHMTPEPPNDFAYWVTHVLQEDEIGERLASIDTVRHGTLAALREAIVKTIDAYLEKAPALRKAPHGEEFYFMRSVLFTVPTEYACRNLAEFRNCLKEVSIGCLYNHIFEARLRPPLGTNDFSYWLKNELGEEELAKKIEALDPYTQTMEGLRRTILRLVEKRLGGTS